ncbi:hypothetical protein EV44_g1835 [Erysiphe necator]|uniref:Uncharacterized protein n=1 Tax=Uncinula necator TaxID=52586 RepID=A0A0B1PDD9_UNCNE|nr:hypothetical protein EV44_g1835 [Erysiphe necator]
MMHQTNGGCQGFPGTLDTSLHVLILTFFLWRMREKAKIPHDVITLAKATIDDCLAQIEVWNGDEANLENEIKENYSLLGYKVDTVKSIISKSKAIYLNQAAIKGAIVQQGLQIMCKADRPQEVILSTPFEDFMACTAGAKAAIANGHDVLSAYFCAATLGTYYLISAVGRLQTFDRDEFIMVGILPRGDGGLGLPMMIDFLCKEHPDRRAYSNYVLNHYALSRDMMKLKIGDRALAMWAGLTRYQHQENDTRRRKVMLGREPERFLIEVKL